MGRDRELGGAEALGYCGTAEDSTSTRRVPQGTGICEDIWTNVCKGEELEGVFDGRVVGEGRGRFNEGGSGHVGGGE